jgi:amidohydrolase
VETAAIVRTEFDLLGLPYRDGLALTGLKAVAQGGRAGPTVGILGELDAVVVADHPAAAPGTGAAHCCGHHAQLACMVGAAIGLVGSGVLPELTGRVAFLAVPAEEYVEIEYRRELRRRGRIGFLSGKTELIRLGEFDDIDMAMMVHAASADEMAGVCGAAAGNNGFVGKSARFIGRAAHAAASPDAGVNALYAATIALDAINAQRETYRDEDAVRVHPVLTRGGDLVNIVPEDVSVETYVRARTQAAVEQASAKVDRALKAGALALGARVDISTLPGYLPLVNDPELLALFRGNFTRDYPLEAWEEFGHLASSTDMGDLSHLMPAIHPYAVGASGREHGSTYAIGDPYRAYVLPAKLLAQTVIDLLADGADRARGILGRHRPRLTKPEYLALKQGQFREETFDGARDQ